MRISVVVCIAVFIVLVGLLRRRRVSLGLPAAYLANLLILHVPGAVAHIVDSEGVLQGRNVTRTGIIFTAIGSLAFLFGVWSSGLKPSFPTPRPAARSLFWRYCLLGGGIVTVISELVTIQTISAVIKQAGPLWMLGIMLALRSAMLRGEKIKMVRWFLALAIYPTLVLLITGFMSYGSVAVIIVLSGLMVIAKSKTRVAAAYTVGVVAAISIFLGYFQHRDEIRAAVWGGLDTDARIAATKSAFTDIKIFDPGNPAHLEALDARLNQNFFVGLAAQRIDDGTVNFLYGRSLLEGIQALIPRVLWPDKPVQAGSPKIVSEMTGLTLAEGTSFGVGNVMEFYINFGIPGLVIGFSLFGYLLARLDQRAAYLDTEGELGRCILYFLPAVAIIQPNGSVIEMFGFGASALIAAHAWRWGWTHWPKPIMRASALATSRPTPQAL